MTKLLTCILIMLSTPLFAKSLHLDCTNEKQPENVEMGIKLKAKMEIFDYAVNSKYKHKISIKVMERPATGACKIVAADDYELAMECNMVDQKGPSTLKVNYLSGESQLVVDMTVMDMALDCQTEVK